MNMRCVGSLSFNHNTVFPIGNWYSKGAAFSAKLPNSSLSCFQVILKVGKSFCLPVTPGKLSRLGNHFLELNSPNTTSRLCDAVINDVMFSGHSGEGECSLGTGRGEKAISTFIRVCVPRTSFVTPQSPFCKKRTFHFSFLFA